MGLTDRSTDSTESESPDDEGGRSLGRRLLRALVVAGVVLAVGYLAYRTLGGDEESEFTEIELEQESAAVDN
jgi:hypothetical protein